MAALTASGLCFDFSNSSYLMREAIHGNQGALGDVIWAQSLAITRNQGGIEHSGASYRARRT